MTFFSYLKARWRLWRSLCPECNSDAPETYICPVCRGAIWPFPQPYNTRELWLLRWVYLHGSN